MQKPGNSNIYADNKKALFDYEIIEEYEAGIELLGEEVKSIRNGNINLKGSYILIQGTKAEVIGMHIGELRGGMRKIDPKRARNLLLSKKEIEKLHIKAKEMGATLVPLSVYAKGNLIKVRVSLAKGKKTWQKKETLKERDLDREIAKKFRF